LHVKTISARRRTRV